MIEGHRLWDLVENRAAASPQRTMLEDESGASLTFGAFEKRAERTAAALAERGVREGTTVAWQLPTWVEAYVLVAALARLGARQVPLLPLYRERELRFVLTQTEAELLIVPRVWRGFDYEEQARKVVAGTRCETLVCHHELPEADPGSLPPLTSVERWPEDAPIRWVLYTSGTTSDPKGALHTDSTLRAGAEASLTRIEMSEADCSPVMFPFTHVGGICGLISQLRTGSRALLVDIFHPVQTPEFLAGRDITLFAGGTAFALAFLQAQRQHPETRLWPLVRACPGGAAPKPPELHYEVKREIGGVGIVSGYGLTEMPILSQNSIRDPDEKLAISEGRASPGVEIRVVSPEGTPLGAGEAGEICARGPMLCKGYLDSSLNAAAFEADGFFHTGDLGYLDEDGFVVITGRLKDVIIRKGENISAKEVEDVLYTLPAVADVAVIGLPDRERGELCCAVVQCKDGEPLLEFEAMVAHCESSGLMRQKIPERLELIDEIPRNASGKIIKYKLRERYAS
jgi:acyl-CoA synthetase (AMP-forming)/AMP-acid ligase II